MSFFDFVKQNYCTWIISYKFGQNAAFLQQIEDILVEQRRRRVRQGFLMAPEEMRLREIAAEIATRTPEVRQQDAQMIRTLRRLGWLVPIGVLRRALLRLLFTSPMFRRGGVGTFQVSTVPVDWALSGTFSTAGVLVGGAVQSRVVAVGGVPAVRPMMTVTLSGDHAVWDGRGSARFLATVRLALESAP